MCNCDRDNSPDSTDGPAVSPNTERAQIIRGPDPLASSLPHDVATSLGEFVGSGSIETLSQWAQAVRRQTGGGAVSMAELCIADRETPHWGIHEEERTYFECFYDAVIVAALADEPVDVRTVSPDGTVIRARAMGSTHLHVRPPSAVFSFGIDDGAVQDIDGEPTLAEGYAAICPYVNAFPDEATYRHWATSVPAATVALPLAGATDLAAALVE